MRRIAPALAVPAFAVLALLGAGLHAAAQGQAEQQLDAALARLRAALPAGTTLEIRERSVEPVTGTATLRGVSMTGGNNLLTVREVVLRGVAADRLAAGEARDLRLGERTGNNSLTAERLDLSGLVLPAPGTPFDWTTISLDAGTLEGMAMAHPSDGGRAALRRLAVRDWGHGRTGSAEGEGLVLHVSTPEHGMADVSLGRVALAGVDVAATAVAIRDGVMPTMRPGMPEQSIEARELSVGLGGDPLVAIGTLRLAGGVDPVRPGAESGRLTLEGVTVDPPAGADGQRPELLGYKRIRGGVSMAARGEENGRRITVEPLQIDVADAGRLTLAAQFQNLPPRDAGTPLDPMARMAAMQQAQLVSMSLRYEDAGLAPRVLASQAGSAGMPEPQFRQAMADLALNTPLPGQPAPAAPLSKNGGPAAAPAGATAAERAVRQALASFVQRPGVLEITLRPSRPLQLDQLAVVMMTDPGGPVQALGLTATAR
ncbi:hypothetical protein [Roseomonas sp. BN140053]|uniref:hypothetical protein n=1 Tax=Roseomonas sp. BN140053 TaxID=3391898 RepID=UPI0039E75F75